MDPNRNKLETIPTSRLLDYFKKQRKKLFRIKAYWDDWVYDCNCDSCTGYRNYAKPYEDRVNAIRAELNKREHVPR